MELTETVKTWLKRTASALTGHAKRIFMAQAVNELGEGGQRLAERELNWCRHTVRKGAEELRTGIAIPDGRRDNGPKPLEDKLPSLRLDLEDIVREYSQADPTFRTPRVYRRLTVAEVRRCLQQDKGYAVDVLPSEEAIRQRLNSMGNYPRRVRKTIPKKRSLRPTRSSNVSTR